MNPETWKRLEAEAQWRLEHPDQSPPVEPIRGMALQLRLWQYPRSGLQLSWSMILPVRDYRTRTAVLRETAWDRSVDRKQTLPRSRTLSPRPVLAPSIRIRDADMDWADLAPYLDAAGRLPMESLGKTPVSASAENRSGLEGYRSLAHIRLEWSGKGPRGWRAMIAWHERFRKALVRVMRDRRAGAGEE